MSRQIQRGAAAVQQEPRSTGFGQRRSSVVSDEPACNNCGLQIGSCGCGGGAGPQVIYVDRATGQQVAPPTTSVAGTPFVGVQAGVGVNNAADRTAAAAGAAAGAAAAGWLTGLVPQPGCFPEQMSTNMGWMAQSLYNAGASQHPAPYSDPTYDWCNMASLFSIDTTVAAGATVEIQLSPSQGTFGAFYYDWVVTDADGIERSDWTFTQPRVQNCPVPNNSTNAIKAQYGQQTPAQCCGIPIKAFLGRRSDNAPLVSNFTNGQAAGDLQVQMRVRGYPCSQQVCW